MDDFGSTALMGDGHLRWLQMVRGGRRWSRARMGDGKVQLCREGGFWKYPEKRRLNFDLEARSLGGGGWTQQGLSAGSMLGVLLWSSH